MLKKFHLGFVKIMSDGFRYPSVFIREIKSIREIVARYSTRLESIILDWKTNRSGRARSKFSPWRDCFYNIFSPISLFETLVPYDQLKETSAFADFIKEDPETFWPMFLMISRILKSPLIPRSRCCSDYSTQVPDDADRWIMQSRWSLPCPAPAGASISFTCSGLWRGQSVDYPAQVINWATHEGSSLAAGRKLFGDRAVLRLSMARKVCLPRNEEAIEQETCGSRALILEQTAARWLQLGTLRLVRSGGCIVRRKRDGDEKDQYLVYRGNRFCFCFWLSKVA